MSNKMSQEMHRALDLCRGGMTASEAVAALALEGMTLCEQSIKLKREYRELPQSKTLDRYPFDMLAIGERFFVPLTRASYSAVYRAVVRRNGMRTDTEYRAQGKDNEAMDTSVTRIR